MSPAPLVSIVVPVHNDEGTIEAALASCLAQTLREIEVVCVDDASDDGTVAVIERMQRADSRIRLVRHEENRSALQARRTGVLEARAEAVLFLDGDDELEPRAAQLSFSAMRSTGVDMVQFGVVVVDRHGNTGGSYEARLAPGHEVSGHSVLSALFPPGEPARGQLWRFLFATAVLRRAYEFIPRQVELVRVNDLPLMFLTAALAKDYTSISEKLYRYHLGRGGSGHRVDTVERATFYASAIDAIDSIRNAVDAIADDSSDSDDIHRAYQAARHWVIGYVCRQMTEQAAPSVIDRAIGELRRKVDDDTLLRAAATFAPSSLRTLAAHISHQPIGERQVRNILVATSNLRTGGVSAVVSAQARHLLDAGFRVTVVARSGGSDVSVLPVGVDFVELGEGTLHERLEAWGRMIERRSVDVVIDHQMLYMRQWPEFAAVARGRGAATIGWLHNFIARPLLDGDDRLSEIERYANALAHIVTLSPLDVAFMKLRGIAHSSFIPNPPSAMLVAPAVMPTPKRLGNGPLRLVWWGRLEERTKRVSELLEVAVALRDIGTEFTLTLIGPDWDDLTAAKVNTAARRRGVGASVLAVGPRRGDALIAAIDAADVFVSTSIIEGYQLTIAEAQSRGLPVFMYELPWLTLVNDNAGVVAARQGDAAGLAFSIAQLASDPQRYTALSRASLAAAARVSAYDFAALYRGVVIGNVPAEYSPDPTLDDAKQLLGLLRFYAETQTATRKPPLRSDSWIGARVWRAAAPAGRRALQRFPGLRPLAHRWKQRMGASG